MPLPRIRILLSLDYELFHGRNFGSPEDVLFEPSERLLDLFDDLGVPATWFPDVCSVWWHREHGLTEYADAFEAQMIDALQRGHDVQLHLHPHWLFCGIRDGSWEMDPDRVYLHEIGWGDGEREARGVVRRGVEYLEELLRPVDVGYRCRTYRAAALALQPEEEQHLRALVDAGLRVDSSVIKGVRSETDTYVVDYRDAPTPACWHIQPETGWRVPVAKGLLEVPVGTFQASRAARARFLVRRARSLGRRRGSGMSRTEKQTRLGNLRHLALMNLRYLTGNPWFTLSCDTKGFDTAMVLDGLRDYVARHPSDEPLAVSVINHPKLMFEPERELMRNFVEGARREYGEEIEFTTFGAVAEDAAG